MPLRLIEIVVPDQNRKRILDALAQWDQGPETRFWIHQLEEGLLTVKVIMDVGASESVLDSIARVLPIGQEHRMIVYPVEATLPRLKEIEKLTEVQDPGEAEAEMPNDRISREELYNDVLDTATWKQSTLVLVALSTIVASLGLITGNVAVLIGSMVIAPLLGPNLGLILATPLGDKRLFRTSMRSLSMGLGTGFLMALPMGFLLQPDPGNPEIAMRTVVGLSDLALALASGAAGVLSLSLGVSTVLVGVMVALSLLPPLAVSGMLLGGGYPLKSLEAAILCLTNIICLNLAGVLTLMIKGVQPYGWWEKERAKKSIRKVVAGWILLLLALAVLLTFKRLI
jgi:uncharacterized hydrophobic protein (TIGR00341 family)